MRTVDITINAEAVVVTANSANEEMVKVQLDSVDSLSILYRLRDLMGEDFKKGVDQVLMQES